MIRNLIVSAVLCLLARSASAGWLEFFNGVSIDAQPPLEFAYLKSAPKTEGRLVLVDFWATWCEPCRTSIPKLNDIHAKFAEKGLVVIGVTKEAKEEVVPFVAKFPMHYFVGLDLQGKFTDSLSVRALPYALIASPSGKVVWRGQPSALSDSEIERLMTEHRPLKSLVPSECLGKLCPERVSGDSRPGSDDFANLSAKADRRQTAPSGGRLLQTVP